MRLPCYSLQKKVLLRRSSGLRVEACSPSFPLKRFQLVALVDNARCVSVNLRVAGSLLHRLPAPVLPLRLGKSCVVTDYVPRRELLMRRYPESYKLRFPSAYGQESIRRGEELCTRFLLPQ